MANVRLVILVATFNAAFCNTKQKWGDYKVEFSPTQTRGSLSPMPKQMTTGTTQLYVNAEYFDFTLGNYSSIMQDAFIRYRKLIFGQGSDTLKFRPLKTPTLKAGVTPLNKLEVDILGNTRGYPTLDSDEFYQLEITSEGTAKLVANEVWGALRGLETFSQLIYQNEFGTFVVNTTSIMDEPRFKHRGLLLDTSRHFLSVPVLKENLDVMAQNKYNVFHWHIVDDQAFPYESITFPDMSRMGAYSRDDVYSQEEIQDIIEYARMRGIRVIPEFDTPGHTQSWGKAIENLLTKCYSGAQPSGSFGPINPEPNSTYDFLKSFFAEIANVFPDHYIHLGGDEVSFNCWESNPNIVKFMAKMGFGKNYGKLEEYYMKKLLDIINNLQKGYMIWQEVIDNGAMVAPDTVVGVWKGGYPDELAKVTSLGYKTLLLSPWYVNYISYGKDWPKYYSVEPLDFNGTESQKALIMGGETCIWGEFVDDTNLISRLWPRASSVAERLWSPKAVNNVDLAAPRLEEFRCTLVRRGYPAEPILGPGYCRHEYAGRK